MADFLQPPAYIDIQTDYPIEVTDIDAINNYIFNLLTTAVGERWWMPTFGSRVPYLIHEPCDSRTAQSIMSAVYTCLNTWLPMVKLDIKSSSIIPDPGTASFLATFSYYVVGLNKTGSVTINLGV